MFSFKPSSRNPLIPRQFLADGFPDQEQTVLCVELSIRYLQEDWQADSSVLGGHGPPSCFVPNNNSMLPCVFVVVAIVGIDAVVIMVAVDFAFATVVVVALVVIDVVAIGAVVFCCRCCCHCCCRFLLSMLSLLLLLLLILMLLSMLLYFLSILLFSLSMLFSFLLIFLYFLL